MRALRSARNASAAHKANRTISVLYLRENVIGNDGAIALADGIKALLMMLCFFWNSPSTLVTRMNTASQPTCSLTRKEAHFRHDLEHVRVARNVSHRMAKRWNIRSDGVSVVCRGIVFAMLITCEV